MGYSEPTILCLGVPHASNPILAAPPSTAVWLPPELLALWTHCAQPPPEALRRRPPLEPEEEAEREVAAEEERRMETLSDIEVTAPSSSLGSRPALPEFQQAALCPPKPVVTGPVPERRLVQGQDGVTLPQVLL